MKKVHLSILASLSIFFIGGVANAQSRAPLPPPVAKPVGLPPGPSSLPPPVQLPGATSTPSNLPPAPTSLPSYVDTAPAAPQITAAKPEFDLQQYMKGMEGEIVRLDQAVSSIFRVVGVQQGSQAYEMGLSKSKQERRGGYNPSALKELGPGSILTRGYYEGVGGPNTEVCLIVLDNERASEVWNTYILPPIQEGSHPQTGYAWLVAHAVAHCLDAAERNNRLHSKMSWLIKDSKEIGIWPSSVSSSLPQSFGNSFSRDGFWQNAERFYLNPHQHQYAERGADAFATLWITRLGASPQGINSIAKARDETVGDNEGVLSARQSRAVARANETGRADRLWDMARDLQKQLNVDNYKIPHNQTTAQQYSGAPENEVAQWVVTPQGVVGVNANGKIIKLPNTNQQPNQGVNFNQLKRFGQ